MEDIKVKVHFRHLMLYYFHKGKNASQAAKKICAVYGEGALADRTVRKWFAKFRTGDFSLVDEERSGRACITDDDKIKALIESNPHYTTREIAKQLQLSKSTIHEHLVKLGYSNRTKVRTSDDESDIGHGRSKKQQKMMVQPSSKRCKKGDSFNLKDLDDVAVDESEH